MLTNSEQRLKIFLGLQNRFDYAEFSARCEEVGCTPLPLLEFSQKAGMVSVAQVLYPELTPRDAYVKLAQANGPRGLGDTIATVTKATGLDTLAGLYTKITGRPCGCASRQEALNKLVPYGVKEVS